MAGNPNPKTDHLTPWKPGESGNPNGRPRKMVSQVLKELDDADIEHVTKSQVRDTIEVLLNCQKEDLMKYAEDEGHSMLIRIVARHMIKAGDNEKLFNMLLDRAFGKSKETYEHDHQVMGGVNIYHMINGLGRFSNEELKVIAKLGLAEKQKQISGELGDYEDEKKMVRTK